MDRVLAYHVSQNCLFAIDRILSVYNKLPAGSGMRKYAALCLAYWLRKGNSEDESLEHISKAMSDNADLRMDVLTLIRDKGVDIASDPSRMPACTFHSHAKDEPCTLA